VFAFKEVMMKISIAVHFCLISLATFSQSLYMPIDILRAYENDTRHFSGKPGAEYWQNHSSYNIDLRFDPNKMWVWGKETIVYHNNSNVELDHLVIRLYQDHFKKGNARNRQIHPDDVHPGVNITFLKSPTDSISAINTSGTNLFVFLDDYLVPGDSIILKIHWDFPLPSNENQRFGKYNGAWFLALWYPQLAVFDDVHGWDISNFGWEQEFYNDFNNFEVNITVPGDHLVQATGTLLNASEVFGENILSKYNQAIYKDSLVHILTQQDLEKGKWTRKKKNVTWKFKARHVPDFAIGISSQYLWDGKSIALSKDGIEKKVFVNAMYNPASTDFRTITDLSARYVEYCSYEMPGVLFPYEKMTLFNGGYGGMEYPMIANNVSSQKEYFSVLLATHEIAHTYFPFMMGINEGRYAWMDEGWAEFLPLDFQKKEVPTFRFDEEIISNYEAYAGREEELVPMVPTGFYNENATMPYRIMAYFRAGSAYIVLHDLLGDALFKKALQEFMQRWAGKHPLPYDFFYTFEDVTEQELDWFWKPWFFEAGYPDLELKEAKVIDKALSIVVEKKGNIPVPLRIKIVYADDSSEELAFTAEIWRKSALFTHSQTIDREVKVVTITHGLTPDIDKTNNTYHFDFE
jgi:hypothetical protein